MKNQNNTNASGLSQKLWVVIGLLVLLAVVIILATMNRDRVVVSDNQGLQTSQTTGTVPGTNQVVDNKVVNQEGSTVRNDVRPMSPDAPRQSGPVDKETLPATVIKLDIGSFTWTPAEFTVKAGEAVSIAVTSIDSSTYIFAFDDPSLQAVRIGVSPGETRSMTFNAPATPGEYTFRSDMRGHANRGAVGKMIVD